MTELKGKTDTDFYSQLAIDADAESEVSEADAVEISKNLVGMDDLDKSLFTKKDNQSKTSEAKKAEMDDIDDLLDELLTDDDVSTKKKTQSKPLDAPAKTPGSPSKIPVKNAPKKFSKTDVSFDDDDDPILSLDDNRAPVKKEAKLAEKSGGDAKERGRAAKSTRDSVLGKMDTEDRVAGGNSSSGFSSDFGVQKTMQSEKKAKDDDLWQSGYDPTAVSDKMPRSAGPGGRRTVRFRDEMDSPGRPVTAPDSMGSPRTSGGKFVSRFEKEEEHVPRNKSKEDYLGLGREVPLEEVSPRGSDTGSARAPTASLPQEKEPELSLSVSLDAAVPAKRETTLLAEGQVGAGDRPHKGRISEDREDLSADRQKRQTTPGQRIADMMRAERDSVVSQSPFDDSTTRSQQQPPTIQRQHQETATKHTEAPKVQTHPPTMRPDSITNTELENRVRRLEMEREHQNALLDISKKRHQEEMALVEESYKNKLQIMEETYQRREQRLREENDMLSAQNMEKLKTIERDRNEMRSELYRKLEEAEKERQREINRLKEQHMHDITALRREHADALEHLHAVRQQEQSTLENAQPATRSFQTALEQMTQSARDLGSLGGRLAREQREGMEEREGQLRAKEEQLRTLQDRIKKQEDDNSHERERLQDLIAKLDHQMKEQARQLEEERWNTRQEQNKLAALRASVDDERKSVMDQLTRERAELDRAKDSVLSEQKHLLSQLHEERKALADERAQFTLQQRQWSERQQREAAKVLQGEADYEGQQRLASEEKRRLDLLNEQMKEAQERVNRERAQIERDRASLESERERLQTWQSELTRRQSAIEARAEEVERAGRQSQEALSRATALQEDHSSRLAAIQSSLKELRAKEKTLAQEKLQIARQREETKKTEHSLLCVNCKTPVRDSGVAHSSNGLMSGSYGSAVFRGTTTSSLDPAAATAFYRAQEVSSQIEQDKTLRLLRIAADKDAEFLEEERAYLQSLEHTPYHNT